MLRHKIVTLSDAPSLSEQPYFPKPARMAASLPSVVRPALLRHIELSASSAELPDMPRPPLGRGGGNAKHWRRGFHHCGSRAGSPSYNLSVSLRSPRPGCGSQRLLRCRSHPAGRCPNSSSLFPPLAAVVAVAPSRGASGEEARLSGMPRPPPKGEPFSASAPNLRESPQNLREWQLH